MKSDKIWILDLKSGHLTHGKGGSTARVPSESGDLDLRSVDFMKFDQNLTKMIKIDQI